MAKAKTTSPKGKVHRLPVEAKQPRNVFCDPMDSDNDAGHSTAGTLPSPAIVRSRAVIGAALDWLATTGGNERAARRRIRAYIKGLDLSPSRLVTLARLAASYDHCPWAPTRAAADIHSEHGCSYGRLRWAMFLAHGAALSLAIETKPTSATGIHDLLPALLVWPGALPKRERAAIVRTLTRLIAAGLAPPRFATKVEAQPSAKAA